MESNMYICRYTTLFVMLSLCTACEVLLLLSFHVFPSGFGNYEEADMSLHNCHQNKCLYIHCILRFASAFDSDKIHSTPSLGFSTNNSAS